MVIRLLYFQSYNYVFKRIKKLEVLLHGVEEGKGRIPLCTTFLKSES